MPKFDDLSQGYIDDFLRAEIRPERSKDHPVALEDVQDFVAHILAGQPQYEEAQGETSVPWYVIGVIHGLEASFSFHTHLHNGDSLNRRTVNEPRGRPLHEPPYTWLDSAMDALKYDGFITWTRWDVPGTLFKIESFNGFGYRNHGIPSPYLWSGTSNIYDRGKYSSDGVFDKNLVSKQVGAATALKYMTTNHVIALKAEAA